MLCPFGAEHVGVGEEERLTPPPNRPRSELRPTLARDRGRVGVGSGCIGGLSPRSRSSCLFLSSVPCAVPLTPQCHLRCSCPLPTDPLSRSYRPHAKRVRRRSATCLSSFGAFPGASGGWGWIPEPEPPLVPPPRRSLLPCERPMNGHWSTKNPS